MIERLEQLLSGKIRKLAIITPPRIGKTTLGNVLTPAFALGRNPTENIISISYGSELSETWGRRVRNILGDPAFAEVFPNCKLSADSAAAYRFTTTAGGEYSAVGRGGPITGRGASLLVLDDLIKDSSEANSDTICRGIVEWLQHVAFTRLTPNGRVPAVATRWSERDPMGWLLHQQGWTLLHLPALAESPADPLGRQIGEALWPSRYPVESLEAVRTDVGSRVFQTLYQGNVAAAQGTIFKRDWFRHYEQAPESFERIIQSWDTSFKTGATNDYSVCATIGVTKNSFYLLSLYRAKVEFPDLKRQVAQLADFWSPSEIYVEDKASGQSLVQELRLSTTYPVIPVKVDSDKETRASATTGYYEAGKVFFPSDASWLADLEDELASFPGGLHDDCVDSLSQALNRLRDANGGYGLLDLAAQIQSGERKPVPSVEQMLSGSVTRVSNFEIEKAKLKRCPTCDSTATVVLGGPGMVHCNNCGANFDCDGNVSARPVTIIPGVNCCGDPLSQMNGMRCGNCGRQRERAPEEPAPRGISRGEYLRYPRGGFALRGPNSKNIYGRFG
jgi:predicted phage terminase large subunit-like protein